MNAWFHEDKFLESIWSQFLWDFLELLQIVDCWDLYSWVKLISYLYAGYFYENHFSLMGTKGLVPILMMC